LRRIREEVKTLGMNEGIWDRKGLSSSFEKLRSKSGSKRMIGSRQIDSPDPGRENETRRRIQK